MGTLPARVTAGTTATSTVSITDNDQGTLAPRNLMATSGLDRRIDLTWDEQDDNAITGYQFRVSSDDGISWNPDWTSISGRSSRTKAYTVRGLTNSVLYTIQVRSVFADGESRPATATAEPLGPSMRANTPIITEVVAGDGSITVYWRANDEDPRAPDTSYLVQYRRNGTSSWTTIVVDRSTDGSSYSSTELTGLTNRTHYDIRIAAVNRLGTSDYSDVRVVTPQAPRSDPPGPVGVDTVSVGSLAAYWTDEYLSDGVHPDMDPLSANTIENDCSSTFSFVVLWAGPEPSTPNRNRTASQWAAHIQTEDGAGRVTHTFATSEFSDQFTNLYGQASLRGFAIISIRVRGLFDGDWGTWSPTANLICLPPDITEAQRGKVTQQLNTLQGQRSAPTPPVAEFSELPNSHTGVPFTIGLSFSREFPVTEQQIRRALTVTGGTVEDVARVLEGEDRRWNITITPSQDALTVQLANNGCPDEKHICSESGQSLETAISAVVSGVMPTRVVSAEITSEPGANGTWDTGETITATVTFNHQVQAYGPPGREPHLVLQIGDARVPAELTTTSAGTAQTFSFTVTDDENGATSARVVRNGIVLNGTPFVSAVGSYASICFDGAHRGGVRAPAQPTGLAAQADQYQVSLSWDAPDDARVTGYRVTRRDIDNDPPGIFTEIEADTCSIGNEFADRDVEPGGRYAYRIQARNGNALSQRSGFVDVTVPTGEPVRIVPDAPRGLYPETVSQTSVTLSWDDPGDDTITGYRVLRQDLDGPDPDSLNTVVDDTGSSANSYTDTTVSAGQRYIYRVVAVNDHGASEQSDALHLETPSNLETPPSLPARPTGLSASEVAHDSVTLSWDDPDDRSITGYRVLRRDVANDAPGVFTTVVENTGTSAVTYVDGSVAAETGYVYRVVAINAAGESPQSSYVNVETPQGPVNDVPPPDTSPPDRPAGLQAVSVSHNSVTLTWDNPGDESITGYRILRRDIANDPPGTFSTIASSAGGAGTTSYTDDGVEAGTRYAYRIVALNAHGESPRSGYVNVTTLDAP